jgi:hypothetical protein
MRAADRYPHAKFVRVVAPIPFPGDTMQKSFAVFALLACTAVAPAHFVFLVPKDAQTVTIVFSDSLAPDENVPIGKIAATQLHARAADGSAVEGKRTEAKDHYLFTVQGKPPVEVGGTCVYGVLAKKGDPYLLVYHPKTILGDISKSPAIGKGWDKLPVEIIRVEGDRFGVLVHGKAAPADLEVSAIVPGKDDNATYKTDGKGQFVVADLPKSGVLALRVRHIEAKKGEHDGKTYQEVRHYATLTLNLAAAAPR